MIHRPRHSLLCLLSLCAVTHVMAQTPTASRLPNRLPAIPAQQYDAAQRQAAADFLAARKQPVFGPFEPLMYSPELMSTARAMGDYLRFQPAIGITLSELVILLVAREWSQDYEWQVHAPIALKQGIRQDIIDAIADARRPERMSDDEQLVYDFSMELLHNKRVADATYARAVKRFGNKGVMDMVGINGYYTLLAMAMNTARTPADVHLPRFPE